MPELTAWYRPWCASHPWVYRSPVTGTYWAFADVANAWAKSKQPDWHDLKTRLDEPPRTDEMPPYLTRALAIFLGLPGYRRLSDGEVAMIGWEIAAEWAALEPPAPTVAQSDNLNTHRASAETWARFRSLAEVGK